MIPNLHSNNNWDDHWLLSGLLEEVFTNSVSDLIFDIVKVDWLHVRRASLDCSLHDVSRLG